MKRFLFLLVIVLVGAAGCKKDGKFRVRKNHKQSVGSSAGDILSDKKYEKLTVQIIYMTGYRPTDGAIDNLREMLTERCDKSDGISIVFKEIAAQNKSSYTLSDVKEIEDAARSEFTTRNNIAVTVLFLDGPSADDQSNAVVLGIAYYNTSVAIFESTVHDYSNQLNEPERYKLETVVLNHEMGHFFGLVNLGTPLQSSHEDGSYPGHCNNPDCLMYWEAETGSAIANLIGSNPIPDFDANCISDLQHNGGK
jgi:predicted Zn-dependent protease